MIKNNRTTKLKLNTETVRALSATDLSNVAGGGNGLTVTIPVSDRLSHCGRQQE